MIIFLDQNSLDQVTPGQLIACVAVAIIFVFATVKLTNWHCDRRYGR